MRVAAVEAAHFVQVDTIVTLCNIIKVLLCLLCPAFYISTVLRADNSESNISPHRTAPVYRFNLLCMGFSTLDQVRLAEPTKSIECRCDHTGRDSIP